MQESGPEMSKVYILGVPGAFPRLEDVVQVAKDGGTDWLQASGIHSMRTGGEFAGFKVSLHPVAEERIRREAPSPADVKLLEDPTADLPEVDENTPFMTCMQTRAIIFVRLLTIVNGQTKVRLEVIERLIAILNESGQDMRARVSGRDELVLAEILRFTVQARDGRPTLDISADEREVLMAGQIPTVGLGAMAVVAARGIQQVSLAVCALTCEAIQANVADIAQERVESLCSPEAVQVAIKLRDLLNGSVRINPEDGATEGIDGISMVPAVHGELEAALERCEEAVAVALRSIPSHPLLALRLGPTIGMPIALLYMALLLVRGAELSMARAEKIAESVRDDYWIPQELNSVKQFLNQAIQLRNTAQQVMAAEHGKACFAGALAAWAGVTALLNTLALESAILLLSLREQGIPGKDGPLVIGMAGGSAEMRQARVKGKGHGGPPLGIGTAHFRLVLEDAVTDFNKIQRVMQHMAASGGSQQSFTETQLRSQSLLAALDPIGEQLPQEMQELQTLVTQHAKHRTAQVPKGSRDYGPDEVAIRDQAFSKIAAVFQRHGAVALDTPAVEMRDMFSGRYGRASVNMLDIKESGGEQLSLRYDLTVPFARYLAQHGISNMKRYQIARVYRKKDPRADSAVHREFFQCDFDIAGNSPPMVADAEVLKVLVEVLSELELGDFKVRLNHRLLLNGILRVCGVPKNRLEVVHVALARLGREDDWAAVRSILCENHGLEAEVVDKIGAIVTLEGEPRQLLKELRRPALALTANPGDKCSAALAEMEALFKLLEAMQVLQHFAFVPSLPGGFEYYTGLVFEAHAAAIQAPVAAGGRYDNLVASFGDRQVRAVGLSLGFERVFPSFERNLTSPAVDSGAKIRQTKTQVLVMSVGKDMQQERIRLASELWGRRIGAEYTYSKTNPFLPEQMNYATTTGVPITVILAPRELKEGKVELMEVATGRREFVPRDRVVTIVEERLQRIGPLGLFIEGELLQRQQ